MEIDYEKFGKIIADSIDKGIGGWANSVKESLEKIAFASDNRLLMDACGSPLTPALKIKTDIDSQAIVNAIRELNATEKNSKVRWSTTDIKNSIMDIMSMLESDLHGIAKENNGMVDFNDVDIVFNRMATMGVDKYLSEKFGR